MRTRTRSLSQGAYIESALYGHQTSNGTSVYPLEWVIGDVLSHSNTESMDDVITPGFATMRKQGGIVASPCTHVKEYNSSSFHMNKCTAHFFRVNSAEYKDSLMEGTVLVPDTELSAFYSKDRVAVSPTLESRLLARAYAKADSSVMQGLVTLAEAKKTNALLHTLGRRISRLPDRSFWSNLRKGNLRKYRSRSLKLKKRTKQAAREWLQFRYGIMQLLYDVDASQKAIRSMQKPVRHRFTASGKMDDVDWTEDYGDSPISAGWCLHCKKSRSYTGTGISEAGVLVEPRLDGVARLNDAFGLAQMLPTVWELTKFSFVIDWFVNSSDIVSAANLSLHKRVLTSWIVNRTYEQMNVNWMLYFTGTTPYESSGWRIGQSDVAGDIPHRIKHVHTMDRKIDPPALFLPTMNVRLNTAKIVDLAALSRSFLKR